MTTTSFAVACRSRHFLAVHEAHKGTSPLRSGVPVNAAGPWAARTAEPIDVLTTTAVRNATNPSATTVRVRLDQRMPAYVVATFPGPRSWSPPV